MVCFRTCLFSAGNTCVKLQSRVTSSGARVVSLIIFFSIGGLGVYGMAEFFEKGRGGGCCMGHFVFWII